MIPREPGVPVRREAELLDLSWQCVNFTPRPLPERESHEVGRRHVTTLMRRMGIEVLYRWPRVGLTARGAAIYPYLL